jgi:hypothetical protein
VLEGAVLIDGESFEGFARVVKRQEASREHGVDALLESVVRIDNALDSGLERVGYVLQQFVTGRREGDLKRVGERGILGGGVDTVVARVVVEELGEEGCFVVPGVRMAAR